MSRPLLVCLLPVRQGEADLPDWFSSAERVADAVVALDDGSTDRTGEMLAAHPLVKVLLRNPPRADYRGWDDSANRNRLLAATAPLEPRWILQLDADERMDAEDAAALRGFFERDAIPGFAYGFPLYRMVGDDGAYDPTPLVVYRLFAFEPGQRFPATKLHFPPIPTSIPRERWVDTTVRIRHVSSATDERRRRRFEKYREADPANAFQPGYGHLLEVPGETEIWAKRAPGLAVLTHDAVLEPAPIGDGARPVLSAIVISRDDETRIERAVRSVVEQECTEQFEVIVVTSGRDRTAAIVRETFPQVRLVELPKPALPGEARNAGLRVARGELISFPGSHVELPPGSLAARIRAHRLGYDMVSGVTLNGTRTAAGWASYFLDHSSRLPGRPSGELEGVPAACSYTRVALVDVGGFPEDMRTGEDTVVNQELRRRGYTAYRAQDVRLIHHSPCRDPLTLLRHHFRRGRGMGRILVEEHRESGGLLRERGALLRGYVWGRLAIVGDEVERWGGDLRPIFRRVRPLVAAGALAAWVGLWYQLLRPRRGLLHTLVGEGPASDGAGRPELPRPRLRFRIARALAARVGFDVVERTIYSPVPDVPPASATAWDEPARIVGFALDTAAHLRYLESSLAPYVSEFLALVERGDVPFDPRNGYYYVGDAALLYATVRHHKPRRILELGGGHSTLVSAAACARNAAEGRPAELVSVDPEPRLPLDDVPGLARVERRTVQELGAERFAALEDGDILFIDTTHTVKRGGEVNYLVLEVLPALRSGVIVQVHDIFLPYDYPRDWYERGWYLTEQYLLQAFLVANADYEVLLAGHAVWRAHPDRVARLIPDIEDCPYGLQAFWMRRRPVAGRQRASRRAEREPSGTRYRALARQIAREHGVPEALFLALVWQESRWHDDIRSPAGAIGLAQLMPDTARELGVDPHDPKENLDGGARYLQAQYERFGSWELALAAYHAGPASVDRHGGIPNSKLTRGYVRAVLGRAALEPADDDAGRT